MAFEKFWQEKAKHDAEHPVEMVRIVPSQSPTFNRSVLLQNIYNVPTMSDVELRKFILHNFNNILNNVFFNGNESGNYLMCFTDARFLDAFIDVIQMPENTFMDEHVMVKLNTICYSYFILPDNNKDYGVTERLMRIANIINRSGIAYLLGLGLTNNIALMLLVARHSNFDINVVVKRVDFIIITQPKELMTQQMITEIFKYLYNTMEDWIRVFPCIMMDVLVEYNEADPKTYWVTDDIQEVDSTLSLSALEILDNLPSRQIRKTLVNYAEGYSMVNSNKNIRFSMRRLSDDYQHINDVIYSMIETENIYVP